MPDVMVDSNVILDVATEDPSWFDWSATRLGELAEDHVRIVNPIVYAEVSVGFATIEAGAPAALRGMALLTRDPGRYRTYFPKLRVIAP